MTADAPALPAAGLDEIPLSEILALGPEVLREVTGARPAPGRGFQSSI